MASSSPPGHLAAALKGAAVLAASQCEQPVVHARKTCRLCGSDRHRANVIREEVILK